MDWNWCRLISEMKSSLISAFSDVSCDPRSFIYPASTRFTKHQLCERQIGENTVSKTAVIGPALSGTVATSHMWNVAGVMKKSLIKFKRKTVLNYWKTFKYVWNNLVYKSTFSTWNFKKSKKRSSICNENLASKLKYVLSIKYTLGFKEQEIYLVNTFYIDYIF